MTALERLKKRTGETDEDLLNDLLETAGEIILSVRFPNSEWPDEVEDRYKGLQIRIALDLYNKRGAEGEISHSENGISRTYTAGWVSKDLLAEIVPYCGVAG